MGPFGLSSRLIPFLFPSLHWPRLPQSALELGHFNTSLLDMSTSGTVAHEESQTRGRKRVYTEAETLSPNSKRPKLATPSSTQTHSSRNRKNEDHKHRELTPAEKEHEKAVKERSLKYRRGDGVKLSVRSVPLSFFLL